MKMIREKTVSEADAESVHEIVFFYFTVFSWCFVFGFLRELGRQVVECTTLDTRNGLTNESHTQ